MKNLTSRLELEPSNFAEGGFGGVRRAVLLLDSGDRVVVAVKFPRVCGDGSVPWPPGSTISKVANRWNREVTVVQRITHPNILPFLGVCDNPDPQYKILPGMVMPLCANGNALKYLADRPQADRLRISCGVAAALTALHSGANPVVHGDIKAVNILIGDAGQALIADFGLSRVCGTKGFTTSNVHGTCRWMAVELLRADFKNEPFLPTTASDIWAFGMTNLEILTGDLPFAEFKSDISIPYSIFAQHARPRRPESLRVTDTIWTLLQRCWEEDALARPDVQHVGLVLDIIHGRHDKLLDSDTALAVLRGQWDASILSESQPRSSTDSLPYKCKWPNCTDSFQTMDGCIEHECEEFEQRRASDIHVPRSSRPIRSFSTLRSLLASVFCCKAS